MKDLEPRIKALELLASWSKWLLSVGAAVAGLLISDMAGFLEKNGWQAKTALFFFVLAVFFASVTLSSIPSIVRRITPTSDPYKLPLYHPSLLPAFVTIVWPGTAQSISFWLGIGFLLIAAI